MRLLHDVSVHVHACTRAYTHTRVVCTCVRTCKNTNTWFGSSGVRLCWLLFLNGSELFCPTSLTILCDFVLALYVRTGICSC